MTSDDQIRAAAREHAESCSTDIVVDPDARVVHADESEPFHYVQAWICVPNEPAYDEWRAKRIAALEQLQNESEKLGLY